jgi:GWxTD domain-containing protein
VLPSDLLRPISALALAAGVLAAPAARATDVPPLRAMQPPFFNADVAVSVDTLAHPTVTVTITLPYAELNWNRVPTGYGAGAGFTVELEPDRRDRLFGGSWEKRLLIGSYDATRSSRTSLTVSRTFAVPPGRYHVRLHVRDVSSEMESSAEDQLTVEDLEKVPAGFADLQLGIIDSAGAFVPVPTRSFGYEVDHLAARVTAFDRRPGAWPRRATLRLRVLDESGEVEGQSDTLLTLAQPTQVLVLRPPALELFIGRHSLEIERVEDRQRWRVSRAFDVEESGPPRGKEFVQMLEALSYVAPSEEVDGMKNLPPDAQAAAWERFWRRRDPTPETPRNEFQIEFFRRLHYASQHFQGFGPGWRSDMGRIYIRYGPADQIEQHPATTSSPVTEIWYYNQPYRRFVFVDREGFGRFALAQPSSE